MTGTLHLDNVSGAFAQNWLELVPSQALKLAGVLLGADGQKMHAALGELKAHEVIPAALTEKANAAYMAVAMQALSIIINPNAKIEFWKKYIALKPEHFAQIISQENNPVKWCFTGGPLTQIVPTITIKGVKHFGPRNYLGGIQFGEYLTVQKRYLSWTKSNQLIDLCRFVACLYRPENTSLSIDTAAYHQDRRIAFVAHVCDERAVDFVGVSPEFLYLAALYWAGCHERMRVDFPNIFKGGKKSSITDGELILLLAGSSRKDDVEQQAQAPVLNVLMQLNMPPKESR